MLWLAGLLGLMAAGTVGVLEMSESSSDTAAPESEATDGGDEEELVDLLVDPPSPDPEEDTIDYVDEVEPPVDVPGLTIGTDTAEDLTGDAGQDTLMGEGGDDTLSGLDGNDSVHGGDGNDQIDGGAGADEVFGNNDNDTIDGGTGEDSLHGSAGQDVVDGSGGDDVVWGGLDDDTIAGGLGQDTLFGGFGNDLVIGVETDASVLEQNDADDGDFLNGGAGEDTLIAGNDDTVTAGDGADSIVLGDWIAQGAAVDIIDFNGDEDDIVLVYDDADGPPELTLADDPDTPGSVLVQMDGTTVAQVAGGLGLQAEDIAVMPLSVAQATGMAPAA